MMACSLEILSVGNSCTQMTMISLRLCKAHKEEDDFPQINHDSGGFGMNSGVVMKCSQNIDLVGGSSPSEKY